MATPIEEVNFTDSIIHKLSHNSPSVADNSILFSIDGDLDPDFIFIDEIRLGKKQIRVIIILGRNS